MGRWSHSSSLSSGPVIPETSRGGKRETNAEEQRAGCVVGRNATSEDYRAGQSLLKMGFSSTSQIEVFFIGER
jgi:hypothetical protein